MNKTAVEKERRVFERFAKVAPLQIDDSSIESPPAPMPDILCCSASCGALAFELVELIDEGFARRTSDMMKTHRMLQDLPSKMPDYLRAVLRDRFGEPLIFLRFKEDVPLRDRERLAIEAIEHYCDAVTEDENVDPEDHVQGAFESVRFNSWDRGLKIETSSAGNLSDPTLERLGRKFAKHYTSEHPIHLLAYVEIDLRLPQDSWFPQVDSFIRANIDGSPFKRVWIFNAMKGQIDYVYPE